MQAMMHGKSDGVGTWYPILTCESGVMLWWRSNQVHKGGIYGISMANNGLQDLVLVWFMCLVYSW